MANTKQAKKRAAQSDKRRARNRSVKSVTRRALKSLRATTAGEPAKAGEKLPATASALDVAVRKGVLHKNTASRLKSRTAKAVAKAQAKA
ncbi:30S ribosomal protein S20 [Acidobacteria bacterium ACD]|nr:MAG: 30S ribosomal protein S20 [Acidobacteriota bacterium]MCE7958949.1 30S ribosomal protein S20 [Acidobacteria bacterium ACB2]MDL1950176.1 30S ribosomal protein S20 [Acidobacteria bacterium ACD]